MEPNNRRTGVFLFLTLLLITACGGAGGSTDAVATVPATEAIVQAATQPPKATQAPEPTQTSEPTEVPVDPLLVSSLDDVESAVVQIVAQGSFTDPQVGEQLNIAGSGTGFIIDPSGIAVTNNHVVTGAALLRVYVGGESNPRNARVLGVSECSDLALIDIEGDGYPYLTWFEEDVNVGLDVYAAGFPLGDPEFTMTRGIISKANADGESSWASLDSVLEHDATINPGNSGGPLVTADAKVVGVNYASQGNTGQYFAINNEDTQRVIAPLREGEDIASIGINGSAVADEENGLYGIWVSSVETGSPADNAGVQAGDIITRLENLVLATDGTMADYCDILRSRDRGDVMRIEVMRYEAQQMLEGQLNGDEIVVTTDFSQELAGEVEESTDSGGEAAGYENYVSINDDSGVLQVDVPSSWVEIDGSAWLADDGSELGPAIIAAPSIDGYNTSWDTPGMEFAALTSLDAAMTISELLEFFDYAEQCTYDQRYDYSDALYTGQYDIWTGCGGTETLLVVLATQPEDGSIFSLVVVQVVTDADLDALDQIMDTFIVNQ